jgi:hypothetical protein
MAEGVKIGSGTVDINADMSNFDNALAALPRKAATKMAEAMSALQAAAARNKLEIKAAWDSGADIETRRRLAAEEARLQDKMDAVQLAATRQATAIQEAARASAQATADAQAHAEAAKAQAAAQREAAAAAKEQAAAEAKAATAANDHAAAMLLQQNAQLAASQAAEQAVAYAPMQAAQHQANINSSLVPRGPKDPRAVEIPDYSNLTKNGMIDFDQLGKAGLNAGNQIRQGGASGAMGLMMLSQAIDDAQYGFRAIVNNIPMLATAIGQGLGMSTEAAFKLGGALGIAAVAINLLINHWDDLMSALELGKVKTEAEEMEALAKATDRTAEATRRLNEYERDRAEMVSLGKKRAGQQEEATHAFEEAVSGLGDEKDTGFNKLVSGLVLARRHAGRGTKATQEEQRLVDAWQKEVDLAVSNPAGANFNENVARAHLKEEQDRIQKRLDSEDVEQAKKTVAGAAFDAGKRQQLANEINKAPPGAFPPKAAEVVAAVKPGFSKEEEFQRDIEQRGRENDRAYRAKQRAETQALNEQGRENERDMLKQRADERDRESSRFASALQPRLSGEILKPGGIGEDALKAKIKAALEKAGVAATDIGKLVDETARKLRRDVEERIREKQIGGLTLEQARGAVLREDKAKKEGLNAGQPKVQSTEDYLRQFLVAGGKPSDDLRGLTEEQLIEQKNMTKLLEEINKNLDKKEQAQAARFGRSRQ